MSTDLVGEDMVCHEAACSFQAPPLSEHQGEAGLMTAPAVLRRWGAGVSYSVALETLRKLCVRAGGRASTALHK